MAVIDSTRTVTEILARVLDGERLCDVDALVLMQSKDLISIGAAANQIRNRKANPGEITFIVDRNINYTNICVTGQRRNRAPVPHRQRHARARHRSRRGVC